MTRLAIYPLTPDRWLALVDLFGERGACGGCWCMYWRVGPGYRRNSSDANKAAFRRVVKQGPPPGLLAFDGDLPVGWCQLTRRDALPHLDRSFVANGQDDAPVWAISCLYVRKGHRRTGITAALIAAALAAAKRAKVHAVEAYPFDSALSPSSTGTGYASTFARAGFRVVAHRSRARPVMRRDLRAGTPERGARAHRSSP